MRAANCVQRELQLQRGVEGEVVVVAEGGLEEEEERSGWGCHHHNSNFHKKGEAGGGLVLCNHLCTDEDPFEEFGVESHARGAAIGGFDPASLLLRRRLLL